MSKVHKEAAVQPAAPTRELAGQFISTALAPAVRRLDGSETAIRLEADPEHVHQARVATSRLRSNLRTFAVLLDTHWAGQLRTELDWLAAAFGAVRDDEVLRERLVRSAGHLRADDREAAEALLSRLAAERDAKRAELLIILDSDRYRELLVTLQAAVERPALSSATGPGWSAQLPGSARRAWLNLKRGVGRLQTKPSDAELHAIRIRAKRCRYAAEAMAPLAGSAALRFALACQRLQEVLGEHQDAVVAQQWLRDTAARSSSCEAFAAGQLAFRERQAAARARRAWPAAWRQLDRQKLRRWLG